MKTIKAVAPYKHKGGNFKLPAFEAWVAVGGTVAPSHYPPRLLHRWAYRHSLPPGGWLPQGAPHLRFVEALSITFDTWPDTLCHEIVPLIWDCWPKLFERTAQWLEHHRVRTAIFTSSQTAERMRQRLPQLRVITITEGIDTSLYTGGRPLTERRTQLYEIGSVVRSWYKKRFPADYARLSRLPADADASTDEGFRRVLGDVQVSVMFPKCYTCPDEAGDIETLTQRFWEAMLSRMVMVGHAPRELVELLGYNPVIELDRDHPTEQIEDILSHIADYQPLVDRNREAALAKGDWKTRMEHLLKTLAQ